MIPKITLYIVFSFVTLFGYTQFGNQEILNKNATVDYPACTEAKDMDGDGDLDIVYTSHEGVYWRENSGLGFFGAVNVIETEAVYAWRIHCADIDLDGDIDVITGGQTAVNFYENLGDGSFSPALVVDTDEIIYRSVSSADINFDGLIDIISTIYSEGAVVYYENLGDGTFGPSQIIYDDVDDPESVSAADLDGDGDFDVVCADRGEFIISWKENLGAGTFGPINILSDTAYSASHIHLTDLDLDGDIDIIAGLNGASWWENLGGGSFGDEQIITTETDDVVAVYTADADNDGDIDVVTASYSDNKLAYYENLGGEVYADQVILSDEAEGASYIFAAEINGDAFIDIIATSSDDNKVSWFQNDGTGNFPLEKSVLTNIKIPTISWTPDINNDGKPDIVTFSKNYSEIYWFENLGAFNFSEIKLLSADFDALNSLVTHDSEVDGFIDFVACNGIDSTISLIHNLGDATFSEPEIIATDIHASYLYSADINHDGFPDIITRSYFDGDIAWLENMGDGTYSAPVYIDEDIYGFLKEINIIDLDLDGYLDLLILSQTAAIYSWYKNNGDGTFLEREELASGGVHGISIQAIDIDNDSDLDLSLGDTWDDNIRWYENIGDLEYSTEIIISDEVTGPLSVLYTDVDDDGDLDLVSAARDDDEIVWWENLGEGEFSDKIIIATGMDGAYDVISSDIDEDGDEDLIALSIFDDQVVAFENYLYHSNQINGRLFVDLNENGINDSTDLGITDISVLCTPESDFTFTLANGTFYSILSDEGGSYVISPDPIEYWNLVTDSLTYTVVVDSTFDVIDSLDFGFFPDTLVNQLEPNLIGGFPRCNTIVNYWLKTKNIGTTLPSGVIHLELPPPINYVSSEVLPDSIVGQDIYWHFDTLNYFASEQFRVEVLMPNYLYIGEDLTSVLQVMIDSSGEYIYDNSDTLIQTIACAYDPNDKIAEPAGIDSMGFIPPSVDFIEYTVRFQNTGTDTALNVLIKDQLDENLDWNSLAILAYSHTLETYVDHTGEISFFFDNIFLPDSNVNELASHGFVKYGINLNEGIPLGTSIYNTAEIYFDANPAVITNTKIHTLYDCTAILESLILHSPCANDSLIGTFNLLPSTSTVTWSLLDETIIADTLVYYTDDVEEFELTINVSDDLCASDTTLNVTIYPNFLTELDPVSICIGDSALIYDEFRFIEGVYYDTLTSLNGCDSIISQELVQYLVPTITYDLPGDSETICIDEGVITLSTTPTGGEFTGETVVDNQFDPILAGIGEHIVHYYLEYDDGCIFIDSLVLLVVDCLSIPIENLTNITIYPNPFSDFTTIDFEHELKGDNQLIIHNTLGQEVYRNENINATKINLTKKELGTGVYLISLVTNYETVFTAKLIVQ